jgi:tetratricopeptide (TPR) repeat protein
MHRVHKPFLIGSFYKSDTLKGIGLCYMELGKLELASAYFKEAFDTISKAKYRFEKFLYHEILYYLGITYYKMSNLKEAIHYLKESKKWIEFLLLRSHYGDLLQGLSKIYISNENYKEAIKTNQKAGHYFQFINDMEGMSSLIEIGVELAHKKRDYDLFTTWISEHINTVLKCPWAFTDELVAVAKNLDVKELLSQEKNQSSRCKVRFD